MPSGRVCSPTRQSRFVHVRQAVRVVIPGHSSWVERQGLPPLRGEVVDCRLVVGPVCGESLDFVTDLARQLAHDAGIIGSAPGQAVRYEETAPIDSRVQLPPISRPFRPVLRRGPGALARDLRSCAVDDQVDRSTGPGRLRQDVERSSSSRQRAVIRSRQVIEAQDFEQRSDEALGLSKREPEHGSQCQRRLDREVRTQPLSASPSS